LFSVFNCSALHETEYPVGLLFAMRYIRNNSFKRLFSFGRRSSKEQVLSPDGVESHETLKEEPSGRPSWKCFSYEDLFDATNGFSSGNSGLV